MVSGMNDFGERVMKKDGYEKSMAQSHLVSRTVFFGLIAGVIYSLWRARLLEAIIGAFLGYAYAGTPGAILFAGMFGALANSFREIFPVTIRDRKE